MKISIIKDSNPNPENDQVIQAGIMRFGPDLGQKVSNLL